jgi:long-chain acyl-CoA synthetase
MKKTLKLPFFKRKIFMALFYVSVFLQKFKIRLGRFFFRSIHREFGGRFHTFISGGAPLDIDVEIGLNALGFRILQGYGLTETSPVVSVNTFINNRFGSVGKPLPGVAIKILKEKPGDAEGEILTCGPHVMKGYFRKPEMTAEAIRDGWFHTGDLGYLDRDGFLFISGRKKNMIVLGGGKKVLPEEVENVMSRSPYIREICVLPRTAGRGLRKGHEEVGAVIAPNFEILEQNNINGEEAIIGRLSSEISRLSKDLAPYKRITSFQISYEELPKTVTKKIRRDAVAAMADFK